MGLFGAPKITLTLEKYSFNPGDIAKGAISLNLKKPIYARKLFVSLEGWRRTSHMTSKGSRTNWQKVYDFDMPISGEKEYMKDTIPFELQIPPDILNPRNSQQAMQDAMQDKLGGAGQLISAITVGSGITTWKIKAQLDVPKKLDVKYSQDIQIYESKNTQANGAI